ncbi:MAG: ABC transporter ATP-binding protein [Dehalococcoidia bacterium]|nr:MAG: ABC transporter ATP-binding protein [Dehalococcoidia bacterium]
MTSAPTPVAPSAGAELPAATAVHLHQVSYRYGDRLALDELSLDVPAGSIFGLLGPNGSGKSTLLSLLIGRRRAAAGEIALLGQPLSPRLRARVGMVFQEPSLDASMTVIETLQLQARMFGIPRAETSRRAAELLERVGLSDRTRAMTPTLSGGMKRRLELARALITQPELILLDEPTLALDPDSRLRLWQHLLEANAVGATLLLATNDVHEAERYCRRVALLDTGRLVAEGTPAELKRGLRRDAVRIEWRHEPGPEVAAMAAWPGVGHVREAGRVTHVTVDEASPFLAQLFQSAGERVAGVRIEESTLEDVYFQLVGRGIASHGDVDDAEAPA